MRKTGFAVLAITLPVLVAAIATAPPPLRPVASGQPLPQDLERYLADREALAADRFGLVPATEKRIRWFDGRRGSKTVYSVVYLHGFSATRQEMAPVAEMIADELQANLFETRLAGHGRINSKLENVHAEDWLADAAEAFGVGGRIGDDVVVIGTSTGATLALAMAKHPAMSQVDTIVMISPNFAPTDRSAELLTVPGGRQLAQIVVGANYSWEPRNALQGTYWTTNYPMDSVLEMMRLVQFTRAQLPLTLKQRILTIISPRDTVVSPQRTRDALQKITAADKHLIEYAASSDEGQHVLAGDILSPGSNRIIASQIVEFIVAGNAR